MLEATQNGIRYRIKLPLISKLSRENDDVNMMRGARNESEVFFLVHHVILPLSGRSEKVAKFSSFSSSFVPFAFLLPLTHRQHASRLVSLLESDILHFITSPRGGRAHVSGIQQKCRVNSQRNVVKLAHGLIAASKRKSKPS